jgi:signal peptidase II
MNRIWKLSLMIVTIILVDQITKGVVQSNFSLGETIPVIEGIFNFTYVRNPGAAFGFLASAHESIRKPLFLFIPVIACFWLIWLIWGVRDKNLVLSLAYSLIFAGAVGNLIDRFSLGYVVDFFDFHWGNSHFPAFNVADSAITIAAFLLIYDFFIELKKNKSTNSNGDVASE